MRAGERRLCARQRSSSTDSGWDPPNTCNVHILAVPTASLAARRRNGLVRAAYFTAGLLSTGARLTLSQRVCSAVRGGRHEFQNDSLRVNRPIHTDHGIWLFTAPHVSPPPPPPRRRRRRGCRPVNPFLTFWLAARHSSDRSTPGLSAPSPHRHSHHPNTPPTTLLGQKITRPWRHDTGREREGASPCRQRSDQHGRSAQAHD